MKVLIFVDAPSSFFCNWLEEFTGDAPYLSFVTTSGHISLQTAQPANINNNLYVSMDGFHIVIKDEDTETAYPLSNIIRFKIISLAPSRIEVVAECNQPMVRDYFLYLLAEIDKRWPQSENVQRQLSKIRASIEAGFDDVKRGQTAIYSRLNQIDQESLNQIAEAIQQGRIEQGEIERTLDAMRRVLQFIQREDTKFDKEVIEQAKKGESFINSEFSVQQKLELTIPIVPYLLSYKAEFDAGSRININDLFHELRQLWQTLIDQSKK